MMWTVFFILVFCYLTKSDYEAKCSDGSKTGLTLDSSIDGVGGRYKVEWCTAADRNVTNWELVMRYDDRTKEDCTEYVIASPGSLHSRFDEPITLSINCTNVCFTKYLDLIFNGTCYHIKTLLRRGATSSRPHDTLHYITNPFNKEHFTENQAYFSYISADDEIVLDLHSGYVPVTEYEMELHNENYTWAQDVTRRCAARAGAGAGVRCRVRAPPGCYRALLRHRAPWAAAVALFNSSFTYNFCHSAAEVVGVAGVGGASGAARWGAGCAAAAALLAALLAAAWRARHAARRRQRVLWAWLSRCARAALRGVQGGGGGGGGCGVGGRGRGRGAGAAGVRARLRGAAARGGAAARAGAGGHGPAGGGRVLGGGGGGGGGGRGALAARAAARRRAGAAAADAGRRRAARQRAARAQPARAAHAVGAAAGRARGVPAAARGRRRLRAGAAPGCRGGARRRRALPHLLRCRDLRHAGGGAARRDAAAALRAARRRARAAARPGRAPRRGPRARRRAPRRRGPRARRAPRRRTARAGGGGGGAARVRARQPQLPGRRAHLHVTLRAHLTTCTVDYSRDKLTYYAQYKLYQFTAIVSTKGRLIFEVYCRHNIMYLPLSTLTYSAVTILRPTSARPHTTWPLSHLAELRGILSYVY